MEVSVLIFTSRPRYPKSKDRGCLLNGGLAGVQNQLLGNVSWVPMKWIGKDMEVIVAYFKALAWRFPGGTEEKLQRISGISVVLVCLVGL